MMTNTNDEFPIVTVDAEIQCRRNQTNCGHKTRFIVLVQGALFLAILMASIVCWNPAQIVLVDITTSPIYNPNITQTAEDFNSPDLPISDRRILYSTAQKSTLFAGIFIGALAGVVPLNMLLQKFGTHKIMICVGIVSVLTTALTPLAAVTNFKILLAVRIIQGTTLSNPFPVIGSITNTWSSLKESGLFVSLLTGYIQLSAIFSMPVSGAAATTLGWDSVFYIHAGVGAVLLALWGYNFRDEPSRHPFVSEKEFRKISHGRVPSKTKISPPYKKIFSCIPLYAVWIATAANFLVAQFAITYMPMYFVYVCKLPVSTASFMSAVPLILQFIFKGFTGVISDKLTSISDITKMRFFNTLAFWGCGFCLILCGLISSSNTAVSVILIVFPISLLGFNAGGFTKGAVLVAKQYSPTVMAVMQVILCLALFGGSFLVPVLTPQGTHSQYSIVFYIYAACLIVTNIIFCVFCSGTPAAFTQQSTDPKTISNLPSIIPSLQNDNNINNSNPKLSVAVLDV
uniref:Major facilitator superfamily (MFS) profile domain-containing protein n=1 Tax=Panagrolaimus sp. ES5 TaxID=591445 RepID=A0AC34FRU3_9BILA